MKAQAMIMPKNFFFDKDGNPLAFGKVYTYQAGTTTDKVTYTTENGDIANPNPVILNGEGYASIYLEGSYNIVVDDQNDNNIWTEDPVSSNIAEEWINCQTPTYISSTSFKISGNVTSKYAVGIAVRIDNDVADFSYSFIKSSSFAAGETTIVIEDSVILVGIIGVCVSIFTGDSVNLKPALINDLSQSYTFKTVALMKASLIVFPVGKKIHWQGYSAQSDGGSNWGIVKSGVHTDDGGSIFTLADGQYVEASLKGKRLSIKKFGAAGDDTADDTISIQTAVDYCSSTERNEGFPTADPVVNSPRIPAGIFKITSSIVVTSYLTISGIGRITSTIKNYMTDGSPAFLVTQPVDTESQNYNIFEDFTIHGNGKFGGPSISGGIEIRYTNRYKFSSMHITQTTSEAIKVFRSDIGMITDCYVWDCGDATHAAVLLDGTAFNFGANACTITGGEIVSSDSVGLHIAQGARTTVRDCAFQAHENDVAILVTSGQSTTIDSNYFELNKGNVKILSGISVKVTNNLHGSPVVGHSADIVINKSTNGIISGNEHLVGSNAVGETTEAGSLLFDGSHIHDNFGTNPYPVSAGILALITTSSSSGASMERWDSSTFGLSMYGKRWFQQDIRVTGEIYKDSETVARERNLPGLTTIGNSNVTLITGTAKETQVWGSPITGDRSATLDATFSKEGDRYRIVRAVAATGAFNLNVGVGPLKALAAGEWCDVYYDGSAWVLTGFGTL